MAKVYRVYEGEMIEINATITPKMVKFESRQPAFGYCSQAQKPFVSFTPQEAIAEKRNSILSSIGMLEDNLKEKNEELSRLETLAHSYK